MEKVSKPKKNHKLKKARQSRGFQGFEIAKKLDMDLIRYMTIEMEWEEPTEEEVLRICGFFRMDAQALGFGRNFWSLCLYEVQDVRSTPLSRCEMKKRPSDAQQLSFVWEEPEKSTSPQERSAAEVVPVGLAVSGMFPCLSIRQPWVWIITHPEVLQACHIPIKDIENRDWTTAMRGILLLHAGKAVDEDLFTCGELDSDYWEYKFGEAGLDLYKAMPKNQQDYARGSIVGQALLSDVVRASTSHWFGGPYGLVLKDAQAFMPIPYRGALKIFSVPESVIRPGATCK